MTKKAFILGANKDKLKYAESDAKKIRIAFQDEYEIYDSSYFFTIDSDEFLIALNVFLNDLNIDDTCIFYFAGHSFRGTNNRLYFALNSSSIFDESSCVCVLDILSSIEQCKARNKLIILDSCKSGAILNDASINLPKTSYSIICAGSASQNVNEIDNSTLGIKGGFLTYLILDALSSNLAVDDNGQITTASLISRITSEEQRIKSEIGIKSEIIPIGFKSFPIFSLTTDLPFEIEDNYSDNLDSKYLTYLELVEKLDKSFALDDIEQASIDDWYIFLEYLNSLNFATLKKTSRLLSRVKIALATLPYNEQKKLIIFFRKHVEIELLFEIYDALKNDFSYVDFTNCPEKVKKVFNRLFRVDCFKYSSKHRSFKTKRWHKLSNEHKKKQLNLYKILESILDYGNIEEKSNQILSVLGNNIEILISTIDNNKKTFIDTMGRLSTGSETTDDFQIIFLDFSDQIKMALKNYEGQIKAQNKTINSGLPSPKLLKTEIIIRDYE